MASFVIIFYAIVPIVYGEVYFHLVLPTFWINAAEQGIVTDGALYPHVE